MKNAWKTCKAMEQILIQAGTYVLESRIIIEITSRKRLIFLNDELWQSTHMMTSSNGNIFCVNGPLWGNPSVTSDA